MFNIINELGAMAVVVCMKFPNSERKPNPEFGWEYSFERYAVKASLIQLISQGVLRSFLLTR